MAKRYVMKVEGKWVTKRDNVDSIDSYHDTKKEAIEAAKEFLEKDKDELVVLRADGTIDNKNLYGVNPMPDEDKAPDYTDWDEGV